MRSRQVYLISQPNPFGVNDCHCLNGLRRAGLRSLIETAAAVTAPVLLRPNTVGQTRQTLGFDTVVDCYKFRQTAFKRKKIVAGILATGNCRRSAPSLARV